jgi:hypothetical protein
MFVCLQDSWKSWLGGWILIDSHNYRTVDSCKTAENQKSWLTGWIPFVRTTTVDARLLKIMTGWMDPLRTTTVDARLLKIKNHDW